MNTRSMKAMTVKGNEGVNWALGLLAALRQAFDMQMAQRFLCGFIAARIWIRLSIPILLELFSTRVH